MRKPSVLLCDGISDRREGVVEIGEDIIDVLSADRQADGVLEDALLRQFLGRKL